jgi:malate synthase
MAVEVRGASPVEGVLTPDALAFVEDLERRFGPARGGLLEARARRQRLRARVVLGGCGLG